MNKYILTICFLVLSMLVFAQNTMITGKIIIDDGVAGQDALDHILITNQTTNAKAFTNDRGMFSIKVSAGDELHFSHDFYKERTLKITSDLMAQGMLTVHLNIETIELAQANVITLDKNLKNNIKLKYDNIDELYKGLNLGIDPNLRFRKIDPNATSMTGSVGLLNPAAWIATISGQRKREKKQQEFFNKVDKIKDLENYFTKNYFIENLHIPESKVNDFVTYCYANFELEKLIKENNYDKITQVLEDQAPKYLEMLSKKSS